jgi:AcrR family transcriptional regulator
MAARAKTRETRRRIVAAAADLFVEHGYGAARLDDVAERAGVAVQTVYFHFGNKRRLLKEAVDVAAVGDDEPVSLLNRPWVERLRAEPEAPAVIAAWIRTTGEIYDRVAPIMKVVRDAAGADADMAEQWRTNTEQTHAAFAHFVSVLGDRGALRPGLTEEEATDTTFALAGLDVYWLLTGFLRWPVERWRDWVTTQIRIAVMGDPGERRPDESDQ